MSYSSKEFHKVYIKDASLFEYENSKLLNVSLNFIIRNDDIFADKLDKMMIIGCMKEVK